MGILKNELANQVTSISVGDSTYIAPFTFQVQVYFSAWASKYVDEWSTVEDPPQIKYDIKQVLEVGPTERFNFTLKSSLIDCIGDEESFFFDSINQRLAIHGNHNRRKSSFLFQLTSVDGFTNKWVYVGSNGIAYRALMASSPVVSFKADPLVYDKIYFPTQTFKYKNTFDPSLGGGYFNRYVADPIPGASAFLIYEDDDGIDHQVYSGIVERDTLGEDEYTVRTKDRRAFFVAKVPLDLYSVEDYPNLSENASGKAITEGYGYVRGIPAYCIAFNALASTQLFKYATDGTVLHSVEVKTEETYTEVTPSDVNAVNCTFELATEDCTDDQGNIKEVKVTATLRDIVNPMEIIVDGNERYLGLVYDNSNYNTTEVESEKIKVADVGIAFTERKDWFNYVEELQGSTTKGFILYPQGDGRLTFRVDDEERAESFAILAQEILNKPVGERDFTEYASTVRVYYNEDYSTDRSQWEDNTDFLASTIAEYGFRKDVDYSSRLTNSTDAALKAANIATAYGSVRPTFSVEVSDPWAFDIKPYDVGTFISKRINGRDIWGTVKGKVIGFSMAFSTGKVSLIIQRIGV